MAMAGMALSTIVRAVQRVPGRCPAAGAGASPGWLGAVELPVPDPGQERPPLERREHQDGPGRVLRVPHGDLVVTVEHLDAAVVATVTALAPRRGREVHLHRPPGVGPCERSCGE